MNNIQCLAAALLAAFVTGNATAGTILDGYDGATGSGDSIGGTPYNIGDATITRVGNVLKVIITTSFASNATSTGTKLGYGDLFLSDAWKPAGTALDRYKTDDLAHSGTIWKYALNIDTERYKSGAFSTNNVSLYELKTPTGVAATDAYGINQKNINTSNTVMSADSGITNTSQFRAGQADTVRLVDSNNVKVASVFDTSKNGSLAVSATALTFSIDITGTAMMDWTSFAIHWGETCQNDVIEGITRVVPEPGSLALFGLGAVGLVAMGRRKHAAAALA